jgi:putative spermidine/putrescine transport system permease protein
MTIKPLTKVLLGIVSAVIALWLTLPTFVVIPMSFTDKRSFSFPPSGYSLEWYERFFSDPVWYGSLVNSLMVAVVVTAVAVVSGTMAALALNRSRLRTGAAIRLLTLAPLVVPLVITGVGVYAAFLQWRLIGSFWGFVAAHSALAIPYVVITVSSSLVSMNTNLELAARSLGATPLRTFFRVTLPHLRGGIAAGALFAFITSFDETVISIFVSNSDFKTLPVQMYSSVTRDTDPTIATASSMIVAVTVGVLLLSLLRRKSSAH